MEITGACLKCGGSEGHGRDDCLSPPCQVARARRLRAERAAPDLLAACKMAMAAVLYAQTVDQSGSFDATRAALSAAIAKAEGGT
jgi:hypothetical protein